MLVCELKCSPINRQLLNVAKHELLGRGKKGGGGRRVVYFTRPSTASFDKLYQMILGSFSIVGVATFGGGTQDQQVHKSVKGATFITIQWSTLELLQRTCNGKMVNENKKYYCLSLSAQALCSEGCVYIMPGC